jgi:subtilase family serine protease
MLEAVDYARNRPDVVSISMSWGDEEFSRQALFNEHLTSTYGAVFFAASGDDGAGVLWPSSSSNVVAVGGTTLNLDDEGLFVSETAWSKSAEV